MSGKGKGYRDRDVPLAKVHRDGAAAEFADGLQSRCDCAVVR